LIKTRRSALRSRPSLGESTVALMRATVRRVGAQRSRSGFGARSIPSQRKLQAESERMGKVKIPHSGEAKLMNDYSRRRPSPMGSLVTRTR